MEWQQKFQVRDKKADLILTRIFSLWGSFLSKSCHAWLFKLQKYLLWFALFPTIPKEFNSIPNLNSLLDSENLPTKLSAVM